MKVFSDGGGERVEQDCRINTKFSAGNLSCQCYKSLSREVSARRCFRSIM